MNLATHYAKRQEIPDDEWLKHKGKWVAFSSEGDRIVASSENLDSLHPQLLAGGEDPHRVVLTRLPADVEGMPLGGLELQ